jgi:hypothetical protein
MDGMVIPLFMDAIYAALAASAICPMFAVNFFVLRK